MPTALITGASAGLGVEFAGQLAASGHDLVLAARRQEPMEALARELTDRHGVAVRVIAMDLRAPDAADSLMKHVADCDIDLLVNNAGFGTHGAFATMPTETIAGMIDLNIRALTDLCRAMLPAMTARGSGAILNVASVAGLMPGPWLAVYYATKAYVVSLSEALHEEVRGHGVAVTALCPGPTRTEFAKVAGMAQSPLFLAADSPEGVVRAGLRAVRRRRALCLPGGNALLPLALRLSPRFLIRRAVAMAQRGR